VPGQWSALDLKDFELYFLFESSHANSDNEVHVLGHVGLSVLKGLGFERDRLSLPIIEDIDRVFEVELSSESLLLKIEAHKSSIVSSAKTWIESVLSIFFLVSPLGIFVLEEIVSHEVGSLGVDEADLEAVPSLHHGHLFELAHSGMEGLDLVSEWASFTELPVCSIDCVGESELGLIREGLFLDNLFGVFKASSYQGELGLGFLDLSDERFDVLIFDVLILVGPVVTIFVIDGLELEESHNAGGFDFVHLFLSDSNHGSFLEVLEVIGELLNPLFDPL